MSLPFSLHGHRKHRVDARAAGRAGGVDGGDGDVDRPSSGGGRGGGLELVRVGDRAKPLPHPVDADDVDDDDEQQREVVHDDRLDEYVEWRRDVVAVVVGGRRRQTVVEDGGQPHTRTYHPCQRDSLERVAQLHAGGPVLDRPVQCEEAVVCEQQDVQRADGAAREVGAHPQRAEHLSERPQSVHGVDRHGGHDQQTDETVRHSQREHVHPRRRVQLLLRRHARHHCHVDSRRDEHQ